MFSFIALIFKIAFSALFGAVLFYQQKLDDENKLLSYSALISIFATSMMHFIEKLTPDSYPFSGASIFAIIIIVLYLTHNFQFKVRLLFLFSAIIGAMCGTGMIFSALICTVAIFAICKVSNFSEEFQLKNENHN